MNKVKKDDITISRVYGNQWWYILWDAIGSQAINADEQEWQEFSKLRANLLSESRSILKDSNIDILGIRHPNKYLSMQELKRVEYTRPTRRYRRTK